MVAQKGDCLKKADEEDKEIMVSQSRWITDPNLQEWQQK